MNVSSKTVRTAETSFCLSRFLQVIDPYNHIKIYIEGVDEALFLVMPDMKH